GPVDSRADPGRVRRGARLPATVLGAVRRLQSGASEPQDRGADGRARDAAAGADGLPVLRGDDLGRAQPGGDRGALRGPVGDRQHPRLRLLVPQGVVLGEGRRDAKADRGSGVLVHALLLHDLVAAVLGEGRGAPGPVRAPAGRLKGGPLRLKRTSGVVLGLALLGSHALAPPPLREQILGTWRLVSFERKETPESGWTAFYGEHPRGYLMYDRTGHMMVTLAK